MEVVVKMKKILFAVFALRVFALAEPRVHDGFYMNFKAGLGVMDLESDGGAGSRVDLSSAVSENLTFKIGGAITPSIVLAGVMSLSVATGQVETVYGNSYGSFYTSKTDAVLVNLLLGPGIVLYPVRSGAMENFFIGATAGLGICGIALDDPYLSWDDDASDGNTAAGFGFQFELGKEWWVGDNWSLGVDFAYTYVFGEDVDYDWIDWSSNVFQVRFTITRS